MRSIPFAPRPLQPDHLALVVGKALEQQRLNGSVEILSEEIEERHRLIVGESAEMKSAVELAKKAAGSRATVVLLGESGTGKEIFARAIHNWSERKGPTRHPLGRELFWFTVSPIEAPKRAPIDGRPNKAGFPSHPSGPIRRMNPSFEPSARIVRLMKRLRQLFHHQGRQCKRPNRFAKTSPRHRSQCGPILPIESERQRPLAIAFNTAIAEVRRLRPSPGLISIRCPAAMNADLVPNDRAASSVNIRRLERSRRRGGRYAWNSDPSHDLGRKPYRTSVWLVSR